MTVPSTPRRAGPFLGDSSTTSFPFTFRVFSAADVLVTLTDPDGVESVLTLGQDYTVAIGSNGGAVTYPVSGPALAPGYLLTITGNLPYDQTADIQNMGGFYPSVVEDALDRLAIQSQQLKEELDRAIKLGVSDNTPADQYRDSLIQAAADAVAAAQAAQTSEGNAAQSELAAHGSASAAYISEQNAATSEGNAGTSEGMAHKWAEESEDTPVAPGEYSAHHWANKASASGSAASGSASAAYASEQKAHRWAEEDEDTQVAPGEYSAHHWANKSSASASAASGSASAAYASEQAAGTSEGKALASEQAAAISEQKAQSYLNAMQAPFRLIKTYGGPCIAKTGAKTSDIRAGTHVSVAGEYKSFAVDTPISMPPLTPGEDYSVWVLPDGTVEAVADPYSSPATAPAPGAVKIGGFHYGLVDPGETVAGGGFSTSGVTASGGSMAWSQSDVDRIAGINEFSIWDLAWHCNGEQRGMTFDPIAQCWVAIYFTGTDPDQYGPSRYNTDVASGTVLPYVPQAWGGNGTLKYAALRSWEANELCTAYGHRLIRYEEAVSAFFGVHEGQSLGGGSTTIPATKREPNYTSRIGVEQATGHAWVIGGPIHSISGSAYAGNGRGSFYAGSYGLVLLGGARDLTSASGSRAAGFHNALSRSAWFSSVRAASDHLNLGRAAR